MSGNRSATNCLKSIASWISIPKSAVLQHIHIHITVAEGYRLLRTQAVMLQKYFRRASFGCFRGKDFQIGGFGSKGHQLRELLGSLLLQRADAHGIAHTQKLVYMGCGSSNLFQRPLQGCASGYFRLLYDQRMLKIFCQPYTVQIGAYHDVRKSFRNELSEVHSQLDIDSHVPQDGAILVENQSAVVAGCRAVHAYLLSHQPHTLRRPGRTQNDRNPPPLQIPQVTLGTGHNPVSGVQQRSVNIQENSRIRTHPVTPPPPSSRPCVSVTICLYNTKNKKIIQCHLSLKSYYICHVFRDLQITLSDV